MEKPMTIGKKEEKSMEGRRKEASQSQGSEDCLQNHIQESNSNTKLC